MAIKKILFVTTLAGSFSCHPFSFSDFFKKQTYKDPTHEEIRECIRDNIYLGTLLGGCFIGLFANSLVLNRELSPWITVPTISSFLVGSSLELSAALILYVRHKTPEKSAQRIVQSKSDPLYAQDIEMWRKVNSIRHKIVHDKQLYIGAAAILAGCLTSYTELDNKNPVLILTVAGIGIIAEKIISELTKS